MFTKKTLLILISVVVLSLVAACGAVPVPETSTVVETEPKPALAGPLEAGSMTVCVPECEPKDGGTLTISVDNPTLDPYPYKDSSSNDFISASYGRLYVLDPYNNVLIPDLATDWEVSDDLTKGTFHLREGVTFQDGSPFTAKDVEWSIKLTMKPEAEGSDYLMTVSRLTELKGAQDFIDGTADDLAGVTVIDDYTIELETEMPNGQFWENVGRVYILPEHLYSDYTWEELPTLDWLSPEVRVGTGPFKLEEHVEGQFASFVANEDYWAGRPYLDRIVFRLFAEHETGTLAFEAGEVDLISNLTSEEVRRFSEDNPEGFVFLRGSPLIKNAFNIGDKPYFEDVRVRQAISYAINRQELIDTLVIPGMREPIDSIFPPGHHYYNPDAERYPYDPDKARELLAEAGWDPEQEVELATYYTSQEALDWMAFIQHYLTRVGIKTTVLAMPWADMEQQGQEGKLDLWFTGYGPDVPGNQGAYFGPDGAWNFGNYDNPRYWELIESAGRAGGDELKEIYLEMQEIHNEEMPSIPIWKMTRFDLVQPKFCGVVEFHTDDHFGYLNYENIYVCEDAEQIISVRPQTPAGLGHPGYTAP